MKAISTPLFEELRKTSAQIAFGWLVTLRDGTKYGFTSSDTEFVYDGVTYSPTNAFSGTAAVAKNNLSVDNMNARVMINATFTEAEVRAGMLDGAAVQFFWINPEHPEYGIMTIRGGYLGEVVLKNGHFEVELRGSMQKLQQPFGRFYTLECSAALGDADCKVTLSAETWQPGHSYVARAAADAGIGAVVTPTTPNGLWYRCISAKGAMTTVEPNTLDQAQINANMMNEVIAMAIKSWGGTPYYNASLTAPVMAVTSEVVITYASGLSNALEPNWPAFVGGTVTDGELVWEAIRARVKPGVVSAVYNRGMFEDNSRTEPDQWYKYGKVTWLTGDNAGKSMEVRDYVEFPRGLIELLEYMPYKISVGDTFEITQGCPKHRAACKADFDNLNNFRGFPDMPTEERALQTPNVTSQGQQQQDDGGGKG